MRGGGKEEKGKEGGRKPRKPRQHAAAAVVVVGATPFSGAPRGRDGGHTGMVKKGRRGGISSRPHDLFRPGGTCASQLLMAAITLPTHWCLNSEKKDKSAASRKINM